MLYSVSYYECHNISHKKNFTFIKTVFINFTFISNSRLVQVYVGSLATDPECVGTVVTQYLHL